MFQCKMCGSKAFQLMVRPEFQSNVVFQSNDKGEVLIQVNGQEFVADLLFMNQFAVCKDCDAIRCWEYDLPSAMNVV